MKKLALALAAATLAVGIVTTHLWLQLRDEHTRNTDLVARLDAAESARVAVALKPVPPVAVVAAQAGQPPPANPREPPAKAPAQQSAAALTAGITQMMASPEGREMTRTQARMQLPQRYPDIGKDLNLTPAQVDKLFDLLARHETDLAADAMGLLGNGMPEGNALMEAQRQMLQKQQANDAEVAALLGGKYQQWQAYEATPEIRQQVSMLQANLGSGDNALGEAQSKTLITALAAEQGRIKQEQRGAVLSAPTRDTQDELERELQTSAESSRRLVNVASTLLNAQQLDSYKHMLDQQQNMVRTLLRTMQGQTGAKGQGTAAPTRP